LDENGVGLLTGGSLGGRGHVIVIRQDLGVVEPSGKGPMIQLLSGSPVNYDAIVARDPMDANAYLKRATERYCTLEDCLQDLDKAIELNPAFALAYYERGHAYNCGYNDLCDRDRAMADYTKAIELDPALASAYRARASIYADESSDQYDPDKAIADYGEAINLDPGNLSAYQARASLYETQGKHGRAIADYDQVIALLAAESYYLGEAYLTQARLYDLEGDHEQATASVIKAMKERSLDIVLGGTFTVADYSRAIELEPDFALAYYGRGNTYAYESSDQYDPDKAIADYGTAIALNPNEVGPYQARARIYERQGNSDALVAAYSEIVDRFPNYLVGRYERGQLYERMGDDRSAIADYSEIIEQDPDGSPLPYYLRGRLYVRQGADEQALADLIRGIELDEYNVHGTVDDYTQAIELDPDFALAYYRRGKIYADQHGKQHDPERAISDLERVLELTTDASLREQAAERLSELRP
jgi:tetratricopeptide (TPR) repeat protein